MIPYGRQSINEDDIDAVIDVLKSDFLTQGPMVPNFESRIRDVTGAEYAVAVSSATAALHLACLALDVSKGDIVWTTPITFAASANAIRYCGAEVDFVDIDPHTYNMCLVELARKLENAKRNVRLPKAIIPVHMAGQSCDMAAISQIASQYGVRIIEDASHAIGGEYDGKPIGQCTYSDICIFSFHPVKIITTAEGGMATTNDPGLAKRLELLRSHGITRDDKLFRYPSDGPWYYEQSVLGFNYRMTDLQAALGASQCDRLQEFILARHEIAARYDVALAKLPLKTPWQAPQSHSAFHLYIIQLQLDAITSSHREVFESLRQSGVGVNLHYIPVYKQPYYRDLGFPANYCPHAEDYYAGAISLPMFPALTPYDQDKVVDALEHILQK